MELYIPQLPPHSHVPEIQLELIDAISRIIHHHPFKQPNEPQYNFDVLVKQNPSRFNAHRFRAIVTFPSASLGKRFEAHVAINQVILFNNFPITFKINSVRGRTIVPHPELIRNLKTKPFKDRIQVLTEQLETEKLMRPFSVSCLEFGRPITLSGQPAFASEYSIYLAAGESLLSFDTQNNLLVIRWPVSSTARAVVIPMKSIQTIEADQLTVTLWMDCPPVFEEIHIFPQSVDDQLSDSEQEESHKTIEIRRRITCPNPSKSELFPYVCDRLRITFGTYVAYKEFCTRKTTIRLPKIIHRTRPSIDQGLYSPENLSAIQDFLVCFSIPVAFQIETLLSHAVLSPAQILQVCTAVHKVAGRLAEKALIEFIAKLDQIQTKSEETEQGHDDLGQVSMAQSDAYLELLETSLKSALEKNRMMQPQDTRILSGDYFPCRTVIVTPTRFIFEGPITEISNSVLRAYKQTENFLRISIREENGLTLRADRDVEIDKLLHTRYLNFLNNGLHICGKRFEFLGYSSSALRDHQAWFVCPFVEEKSVSSSEPDVITAASIRQKLGDFSKVIHIPARYMARVAQAFTSTRKSLTLLPSQIVRIEDVERNGSCFTDGVGTISPDLAEQVNRALSAGITNPRRRKDQAKSTCFQIRLGGFKGMLSVDSTLKKSCICVRPSMDKFTAPDSLTLDIALTFSRPLPAYLNRPMIKVLEDLGIHEQVFLTLQRNIVQKVEHSRTNMRRAAELMRRISIGQQSHLATILRHLGTLLGDETDPCSEFLEECYDLMIMQSLRDLKYRARIPLEDSYTLVGVADEDQVLAPNSIYACIQVPGKAPFWLKGPIAISRSPCLHPGDVRVVHGIGQLDTEYAPRLSKLVNCVVFSVKGVRSLPSCLGGGDLDGDLYTLITLPELIPQAGKLHPPASYAPPEMKRLDRPCTIKDGAEFFLDYISSDLVGVIASRHLHVADQQDNGTKDDVCLELAALHSDAVDYPKTGVPVKIEKVPKAEQRMKPDFMCPEHHARKEGHDYYESQKVLGKLFRQIPAEKINVFHRQPDSGNVVTISAEASSSRSRLNKGKPLDRLDPSGVISRSMRRAIKKSIGTEGINLIALDSELIEEFKFVMKTFSEELMTVCKLNSLSRKKDRNLSETEAFMGVITDTVSDKRLKQNTVARLEEQTDQLFENVRCGIMGLKAEKENEFDVDVDENDKLVVIDPDPKDPVTIERQRQLKRAFNAWHVATLDDAKSFGTHSFGFLALGIFLTRL